MSEIVLLLANILTTGFIGFNILSFLSSETVAKQLAISEKIPLSIIFGYGVVSIQMFLMGLLNIKFTRINILIPWIILFFANLSTGKLQKFCSVRVPQFRKFRFYEVSIMLGIVLQTFYNFLRALIKPMESYDAVAIHGLKSKVIFFANGIGPDFFKTISMNFGGAHPDYPLLLPLCENWVYVFLGNFNDQLVKIIFPLFYISILFLLYAVLKKMTGNTLIPLLMTFALSSIKQFSDYATIGYADLILAVYFGTAIFYLYLWSVSNNELYLKICTISLIFCVWTKNEGMLLALIGIFLLFVYGIQYLRERKKTTFYVTLAILSVLCLSLLWHGFKHTNNLINENFNLSMVNTENLIHGLKRIPLIIYEYQKQFFGFKKWNLVWIVTIFLFIKDFRYIISTHIKLLGYVLFLFALGYTTVYIFTTTEIDFLLRTTASRFLIHILPVAVLWLGMLIHGKGYIKN